MENENYQGPPLGSYEGGMLNEEMFNSLWNSKFYKLNDVATLSAALLKIDYSVVARVGEHTWDRARFESKVAFWVVPAPQMDP